MRLPWSCIEPHLPRPGIQVNVNHADCPAGPDTKRRLYIKNTGTRVLAYCHHCNGHKVVAVPGRSYRDYDAIETEFLADTPPELPKVVLPEDCCYDTRQWPTEAWGWLFQHHVTEHTTLAHSICYSPSWGRVIVPVFNGGELLFWQGRNVGLVKGPKYVSFKGAKKPVFASHGLGHGHPQQVVVVEDMLSAIRIAQDVEDVTALALLGTSLHDEHIEFLQKMDCPVLLWLDYDDAGQKAEGDIYNRLQTVLTHPVYRAVRSAQQEPKQLTPTELSTALRGH
jgi:DNA primase